jgi:hypothetical protein
LRAHGTAGEKNPPPDAYWYQNRYQYLGNAATKVVWGINVTVTQLHLRMIKH